MRPLEEIRAEHSRALSLNDVDTLKRITEELSTAEDVPSQALRFNTSGQVHRVSGELDLAIDDFTKAAELCEQSGNLAGVASNLGNIALIHESEGKLAETLDYLHRAEEAAERSGNKGLMAALLNNLGSFLYQCSDYPSALHYLERAVDLFTELNDDAGLARTIGNMGMIYHAMNDMHRAHEYYERSRQTHIAVGNRLDAAIAAGNLAMVLMHHGKHDESLTLLGEALEIRKEIGNPDGIAMTLGKIVNTLLDLGRLDDAAERLKELDECKTRNPALTVQSKQLHARMKHARGDAGSAREHYEDALKVASERQLKTQQAELHRDLRELAYQERDIDAYVHHNNEHVRLMDETKGQEITRKLAAVEVQKRIDEERAAKEKQQALLYNALPQQVADRVLKGESVNDEYDTVAIMFMDIVGFTTLSSSKTATEVVELLSTIFTQCDRIAREHHITKIKTIGDCYMAVAFPVAADVDAEPNVALRMAIGAIQMRNAVTSIPGINVRVGLNCGPIVAGVIGTERLQYDVWGDSVNVASRMESTGEPGCIQVSDSFAQELIKAEAVKRELEATAATWSLASGLKVRGETKVKGKGVMTTYWLNP